MTKSEILERLCALCSHVGGQVFDHMHATDCFCEDGKEQIGPFQFEEQALDFIEQAVEEKIKRESK